MIPQIHKQGSNTLGLLNYLYGKGTHEVHVDPHLVASFDHMAPDPGRDPNATKQDLQHLLDQPLHLLDPDQRPEKHVWHCSVRAAPDDPVLTDEQWADIARRIVAATGIDPSDGAGCRWAAVRHADDHIHIIATLVREDGRRPDHHRSGKRAQAEARLIENDYDLHRVNPGDGTAAKRPTSAERHKAARHGHATTPREQLRETVRRAVAGATSETEFFGRLTASGLVVRQRLAPSGDLLGYKVALPDDVNKDGQPVFYPGSKLAPDLSLPRIRERWSGEVAPDPSSEASALQVSGPAAGRRRTSTAARQSVLVIDHGTDAQAAAHIAATGEVLDALATTSAEHTRRELREAARTFERATRSHIRAARGHDRALRQAARDLIHSGPALGHGEDGATTAMLIDMLFFLVTATAHWHAKHHHAQQATAARQSAEHLHAAYQTAATQPLAALHRRGRNLSRSLRQRQTALLHSAVPELAERILAEPGWYALAVTLADAEAAGHEPGALLADAAASRELDTAHSVSETLAWRLRRTADLPHGTSASPQHNATAVRSTGHISVLRATPDAQPQKTR
ncbi:relaxase/mobilization nuclease domain-containing protein [Streptomyces niveus]|uniref:relaxase/mobilization nuclease domain-containing protein n=1 Tax=Streptomyces niveus TaxID=193462 RepID=UPI0036D18821